MASDPCAVCGRVTRMPAELGGVTLCVEDFKPVQKGDRPIGDGRWWERVWVRAFDGTVTQLVGKQWLKKQSNFNGSFAVDHYVESAPRLPDGE